jgi:hypothetical protein
MRRSNVLSFPLQLVFPALVFCIHCSPNTLRKVSLDSFRQGSLAEGEDSVQLTSLYYFRLGPFYIENIIYLFLQNKLF